MVVPLSETLIRFLRACSLPLRIASGTSLALPMPTPTWPWPSPTTTSAAQLKRRPPFTTLATWWMWMTRSCRSSRLVRSMGALMVPSTQYGQLDLETCFTRAIGEGANTAVIEVAVAIEHHLGDALFLAQTRDGLA